MFATHQFCLNELRSLLAGLTRHKKMLILEMQSLSTIPVSSFSIIVELPSQSRSRLCLKFIVRVQPDYSGTGTASKRCWNSTLPCLMKLKTAD